MDSLESDLQHSAPCLIDVQNIISDQGAFCVVFLRNEKGEPLAHWITNKKSQTLGLIKALQKFKESRVH